MALFLAEMAVATGDEKARETQRSARSGRRWDGQRSSKRPSSWGSIPAAGLALVAARVGRLLQAEDIVSVRA
ncbi:MAG: hypothetical protein R2849_13705 [Thermomicrobiales bacterium]